MIDESIVVVYWDASAVLSALMQNGHSEEARTWIERSGVHLISTLCFAEVCAVLARIERERLMAEILVGSARKTLQTGPWGRLNISPRWEDIEELAHKWSLRGADLWHLAAAKSVQKEIPELRLLTFDDRLRVAAFGEGLIQ